MATATTTATTTPEKKPVVVTLTDLAYQDRAKRTILDVRTRGQWTGDIVLITVGFHADRDWLDFYEVTPFVVTHLDTDPLLREYERYPLQRPTCDQRETKKLTQWDKFYVFHSFFRSWSRVIFLDAGLRVCSRIQHLLDLPMTDDPRTWFMAPDDAAASDTTKRFGGIIEVDHHVEAVGRLWREYDVSILSERYFLNCIWMYDTRLLDRVTMQEFVDAMYRFPICRCNEMTIMNLLLVYKYRMWTPFPDHCLREPLRRLFGWTEHDRDYGPYTTWRDFCFLKYPSGLAG